MASVSLGTPEAHKVLEGVLGDDWPLRRLPVPAETQVPGKNKLKSLCS